MTTPQKYTVILREEEFVLYRSQIEFDAPNYFTACFLGTFTESSTMSINLDRNPDLFAIIVEYMSGYHILPLSSRNLPRTMDVASAMANLVEDAAFYGMEKLHALLTRPAPPKIDFAWTGFSSRVITFDDVLKGKLPEGVSYNSSGLVAFDGNSGQGSVMIFAKNIPIRLVGNLELDKAGRPPPDQATATYHLDLTREQKSQLERQPYSAFEFNESNPLSLVVTVLPDSRLHIDGRRPIRFEQFAFWWRARHAAFAFSATGGHVEPSDERASHLLDEVFPLPFEDVARRDEMERNQFVLWGDEMIFVINARGFIAGTLQLHVKLLNVRARTRAAVLDTIRPHDCFL